MDKFQFKAEKKKESKIGEGTYGIVYHAFYKDSGIQVALKKIKMGKFRYEGISFTALREVKALRECSHENVVNLFDVFVHNESVYLVYEFCPFDLEKLMMDKIFSQGDIKSYMYMLLQGLNYIHKNWILHRDLKPNNLLLDSSSTLKIGDFGFARKFGSPNPKYSSEVVTRWYRSPELLFGANSYGIGIDMWAVGCIFAELMIRNPLFPGDSDLHQLQLIFTALGVPSHTCPSYWSEKMQYLPSPVDFQEKREPSLNICDSNGLFKAIQEEGRDLLNNLLKYEPNERLSAEKCLEHDYFKTGAPMSSKDELKKSLEEFKKRHLNNYNNNNHIEMTKRATAGSSPNRMENIRRKINFDD